MRQFHYYHADTGKMHSKVFKCDSSTPYGEQDAKANAPQGHLHIESKLVEHWKYRVDVLSKSIIQTDDHDLVMLKTNP